jgi:hypothetical protein
LVFIPDGSVGCKKVLIVLSIMPRYIKDKSASAVQALCRNCVMAADVTTDVGVMVQDAVVGDVIFVEDAAATDVDVLLSDDAEASCASDVDAAPGPARSGKFCI